MLDAAHQYEASVSKLLNLPNALTIKDVAGEQVKVAYASTDSKESAFRMLETVTFECNEAVPLAKAAVLSDLVEEAQRDQSRRSFNGWLGDALRHHAIELYDDVRDYMKNYPLYSRP